MASVGVATECESPVPTAPTVVPQDVAPCSVADVTSAAPAADIVPPVMALPQMPVSRRIVWLYVISLGGLHLLALLAFVPYLFSWSGVVLMGLGVHIFGQGVTLCYHRLLTHRSFTVPRWLEWTFVTTALCCLEETPGKWVSWHRLHHNHSDDPEDPHSPLVNFLWSHFGWLLLHNSTTHEFSVYNNARDILSDPYYKILEKNRWMTVLIYTIHAALFYAAGWLVGWSIWGVEAADQLAASWLVWGVLVRTVVMWHVTWSVNSLSHLWGYRNYETSDHSRNNWFVAVITGGEGWHNNHHHDQASACNQHRWWEFDVTWYEIRLLEKLGLAKNVIRPRHVRQARAPTGS